MLSGVGGQAVCYLRAVATVTVTHPHVESIEFIEQQTVADWRLPMELFGGEAVMMSPVSGPTSWVQGKLFSALDRWQEQAAKRGLVLQEIFVALPGGEHLAPDISWWSEDRRPPIVRGPFTVVPDLVVEVLSPSTRMNDLGPKRQVYMDSGVRELWLADPEAGTLTRVMRDADDEVLAAGAVLRTDLLEGFAVDLARVF